MFYWFIFRELLMDFQLLASLSLTGGAGAIDIDDAMCDVETAWVVGFQTGREFLALDARDAMAVVTDLIAARTVVGDAFKDRCGRREGMANEQVGLHQQLRGLIERADTHGETAVLHRLLKVLNREGSFDIIDRIQNGKPFAGLSALVGNEEVPELRCHRGL